MAQLQPFERNTPVYVPSDRYSVTERAREFARRVEESVAKDTAMLGVNIPKHRPWDTPSDGTLAQMVEWYTEAKERKEIKRRDSADMQFLFDTLINQGFIGENIDC